MQMITAFYLKKIYIKQIVKVIQKNITLISLPIYNIYRFNILTWHQVCSIYDKGTVYFYSNRGHQETFPVPEHSFTFDRLLLGGRGDRDIFSGAFADVQIWNYAIDNTTLTAWFNCIGSVRGNVLNWDNPTATLKIFYNAASTSIL